MNQQQAKHTYTNPQQSKFGLRGLSRSSATRATVGQNAITNHPGTATSHKRQTNGQVNNHMNLNLINRKLNGSQNKNVDFFPIQTTSYTSTGKANQNLTTPLKKSSDFKQQAVDEYQQTAQGFSSLLANASQKQNKVLSGTNTANSNAANTLPSEYAPYKAVNNTTINQLNKNLLMTGSNVTKTINDMVSPKHRNSGLNYKQNTVDMKSINIQDKSLINKITDNIRKLSYAAKAGQMQLQSAVQDHTNQYGSQQNLIDQIQSQQQQITQLTQSGSACQPSMSNSLNNKSIAFNAGQSLIIPPPSNLGLHTRDSYLNMKQQATNLKKEVRTEHKHQDSKTSGNGINTMHQDASQTATNNFENLPFVGLKNSGSQYQLTKHNQILFSNASANQNAPTAINQSLMLAKQQFDSQNGKFSGMGLQAQLLKQNQQMSPTHSYLNTRIQNSVDIKNDIGHGIPLTNQQILSSKRRINALSYAADTNKILPSGGNQLAQQMSMKQARTEVVNSNMNNQHEQKNKTNLAGIAGKNININTAQGIGISVQNNYYDIEKSQNSKEQTDPSPYNPSTSQTTQNSNTKNSKDDKNANVNVKVSRKLQSRPHKVYDYLFIQMSNEQFKQEYHNKKIFAQKTMAQMELDDIEKRRNYVLNQGQSPFKIHKSAGVESNLNSLVQIKAFDNVVTDELPLMQCNLLPTQLDHVKMLICEQEDKNYPKLTLEAALKFESEKQNQIKQYMEDIIVKLKQKDRRFKVTVKKKFIDDALYNTTSLRVASVYVIVINREKAFDLLSSQPFKITNTKHQLTQSQYQPQQNEESSEEVDDFIKQQEQQVQKTKDTLRRSANPHLNSNFKSSLYEQDNIVADKNENISESNKALPTFKATLLQEKPTLQEEPPKPAHQPVIPQRENKQRPRHIPSVSNAKQKQVPKEEQNFYRYVTPVKEYPAKFNNSKIKICQDMTVLDHVKNYPLNTFFNQYNEFVKLIFKNQKQGQAIKFSQGYVLGLARTLGLNVKRDAFSDQNMKQREHINLLKEKLSFVLWRKLHDENKDVLPTYDKNNNAVNNANESSSDIDGGNSIDSTIASSNTPKSKTMGLQIKTENDIITDTTPKVQSAIERAPVAKDQAAQQPANQFQLPHSNVIYKYVIGKGNNSMMVKGLLKNRYWWVQGDYSYEGDLRNLNFIWTQNKVQKIFENMQCKFPYRRSGNKHHEFSQITATPQTMKRGKKKITSLQNGDMKTNLSKIEDAKPLAIKHSDNKLYNKIEDNFHVNNKKALYINMKNYYEAIGQDVFENLPLTFHIKTGFDDPEFKLFEQNYQRFDEDMKNRKTKRNAPKEETNTSQQSPSKNDEHSKEQAQPEPTQSTEKYYRSMMSEKNIWIIKPGENTNRGIGIQVAKEMEEIKQIISDSTQNKKRTCILQKYIHNPLLIHRRKFDIRTFVLATSLNGNYKVYQYAEGYLRTSCREYSIYNLNNKLVHLTNDAVQKQSQDYGRYEPGNKLSYNEFQAYLDKNYPDLHVCFERDIVPQMNKMTIDIFRACHDKLDPKRRLNCMEVFGLDFMIDDEFRPFLIEVNTNPCLELSCPLLARLVPQLLENAFKIGVDTTFLPPEGFTSKKGFIGDACPENRFTLVYDEKVDAPIMEKLLSTKRDVILEMDEEFSDDEDVHDDDD